MFSIDCGPSRFEQIHEPATAQSNYGGSWQMRRMSLHRGLRLRVSDVLELLGAGASFEEVLADYPFLEREDILAALEYAAHQTDHVVLQGS
jgi:Protein of unknown function (DUF433)